MFFPSLIAPPMMALSHHRAKPRVCRVLLNRFENYHINNYTNYTVYTTVNCYHSCCDEGCCVWSISSLIIIFLVIIVCSGKCIRMYWKANCGKNQHSESSVSNNSRENILMTSTNTSRDGLQNYGTNNIVSPPPAYNIATLFPRPQAVDRVPPTYEEATNKQ